MILIIVLVCIVLAALLISFYENKHFVVKKYEINNEYFKNSDIKAVFISDLHDCIYGENNEKLLSAIEKENPDFIIFGGDIFNGIVGKENSNAENFLKSISLKYKCVYGMGNHEYRYFLYPEKFPGYKEKLLKLLRECSICFLDNSKVNLDIKNKKIDVFGLSIEREYYKRFESVNMADSYVSHMLPEKDENVYSILLAHNPKYFKAYSHFRADLILSGHYHGGLMRFGKQGVVSPTFGLFPKYSYGLQKNGDSKMIVSGGMGVHTLPFRIFNRPELIVINFKA